jgi:hypothetical protein
MCRCVEHMICTKHVHSVNVMMTRSREVRSLFFVRSSTHIAVSVCPGGHAVQLRYWRQCARVLNQNQGTKQYQQMFLGESPNFQRARGSWLSCTVACDSLLGTCTRDWGCSNWEGCQSPSAVCT